MVSGTPNLQIQPENNASEGDGLHPPAGPVDDGQDVAVT